MIVSAVVAPTGVVTIVSTGEAVLPAATAEAEEASMVDATADSDTAICSTIADPDGSPGVRLTTAG